ncbi:unnamed protein product [Discosporangium mesarthrocarpum]
MSQIVRSQGDQRLRLGIPDTILFHDGVVQVWLFTSKTGEVLAKRAVRKAAVKERFLRLSLANPNNLHMRVAMVRFGDGIVRNLGHASFKEMMQKFPPPEPGIMSLQCYIQSKGQGGTVYRNSYSVVNDKGLVVTSTNTFTTVHPDQADLPVSTWSNREIKPIKSSAVRINVALDAVTCSIVRFLEQGQKIPTRVLHLECDYVIDEGGQIWLVWTGESTIAVRDAAQDLRLADVRSEGLYGRGSFLGREAALATHSEMGAPPVFTHKGRRTAAVDTTSSKLRETSKAIDLAAGAVELPRGVTGEGPGGIVDAISRAEQREQEGVLVAHRADRGIQEAGMGAGTGGMLKAATASRTVEAPRSTMTVGMRVSEAVANEARGRAPGGKYYPSSFSCMGDYCAVRVLDPREDADHPQRGRQAGESILGSGNSGQDLIKEVAMRLFSAQELSTLRRDAQFRRQMEEGLVMEVEAPLPGGESAPDLGKATGAGAQGSLDPIAGGLKDRDTQHWAEVITRSILLARQERRGMGNHSSAPHPEIEPQARGQGQGVGGDVDDEGGAGMGGGGGLKGSPGGGGRGGGRRPKRLLQETEASGMRQHARKREEDLLAGGAQNYYTPVRVCQTCFRVYALLDQARVVLARNADLDKEEAMAYEKSDYLDPQKAEVICKDGRHRGHHRLRTQVPPGRGGSGENFDWEGEEEDQLSLSFEDIGGSRSQLGDHPLPVRSRSQGDDLRVGGWERGRGRGRGGTRGRSRGRGQPEAEKGCHGEGWEDPNLPGVRARPSWRGRLEGLGLPAGHEHGLPLSSGSRFEDLDDYLRGRASKTSKRARREQKRAQRDGAVMQAVADSEAMTPGEGLENGSQLHHARVMLADADLVSAQRAKDMLEMEGYMVTVNGDGKQVLEAIIEGEGEWDVLLIERNLPVMDGFGVTAAVRDFEKAQRNKAARLRGNAVEEAGREWRRRGGHGVERDKDAPSAVPEPSEVRHLPIVCITDHASPDDLRSYMAGGMDGCVSKPLEPGPLLNTLRAAVPRHLTPAADMSSGAGGGVPEGATREGGMKATRGRAFGVLTGSAAAAAEGMCVPASSLTGGGDDIEGALQIDADTCVPYCVVGSRRRVGKGGFYNLVVCHDIFDNYERMKITLKPLLARYPGAQALLWNYPGQAFSEWREEQLLNNEYLATILQHLLLHIGNKDKGGTGKHTTMENCWAFDLRQPFHLVGFGNGGAVATFHASHFSVGPSMRSLLLLNSFSYVDAYLGGVLHDCMNVFSCSPESRPDLPVYFYARFLFSPAYLAQVSTPLALNIYTAVHNPISVRGRIQLCKGALAHVDTRPVLGEIDVPVICVQSTQNNLIKPLHTDPYVSRRGGEVRTIHKALNDPTKTCVVWMNAGHEIFQEARGQAVTLLEQVVAGYHEKNDVVHTVSLPEVASQGKGQGQGQRFLAGQRHKQGQGQGQGQGKGAGSQVFEDSFIDNVLKTMSDIRSEADHRALGNQLRSSSEGGDGGGDMGPGAGAGGSGAGGVNPMDQTVLEETWNGHVGEVYGSTWEEYRTGIAAATTRAASRCTGAGVGAGAGAGARARQRFLGQGRGLDGEGQRRGHSGRRPRGRKTGSSGAQGGGDGGAAGHEIMVGTVLDAEHPAFERQNNLVYRFGHGSKVYPEPEEFPEVKEYMSWRLKRNRKRLERLDHAAHKIQGVMRAHLAYQMAQGLRGDRAALHIQRTFRGWQGRLRFLERLRSVWAAQIVQRNWRGHASRRWFDLLRRQQAACGHIQRVWRGAIARRHVAKIRETRNYGASLMQALWRGVKGRRKAFKCRNENLGATTIQRIFRGHQGRQRAGRERDKYLFSRSQSQGVEFGRQMLLEHKLHATRLQSEVQLLTSEKAQAEESVEAMMEEVSEFEEAVTALEREMHQLSKIETEATGVLDEEARFELREQKIRLDKEFGEMLGKIADRKDRLQQMEKKLATLDRTRLGKEEELRTLERKLVVLLEEQQRELENIRRRQDKKGELLLKSQRAGGSAGALVAAEGYGGPSAKDKRQAAQLMQSTETLMKFGFMSMSMTYFSSLNMIRAMRSVGASDTVMAALAHNTASAEAGGGGGGGEGMRAPILEQNKRLGADPFSPSLKPGQLPGQEPLRVSAWSVDDIARWLQTLTLSQYQEAFISAAVDGAFLYDLNDDDLRNTLGVEHRLHRKKILSSIMRLKAAEAERDKMLTLTKAMPPAGSPGTGGEPDPYPKPYGSASEAMGSDGGFVPSAPIDFKELMTLTRRVGKYKKIREILEPLPIREFDKSIVRVPYVPEIGTAYVEAYEQEPFNLNKMDENGNTLLLVAAQNGSLKLTKLFVSKGANPNHQNKMGNTAGHYAVSYQFFDLSEWLFMSDGTGAGADDTVENKHGLGPYDGLQPEGGAGADQPLLLES